MSKWNQQLKFSKKEADNGLPPHFLDAIVAAESADDPNAVSQVGAQGLFQFMPKTAAGYGIDPFNPEQAAGAAAKMYGELGKKYNHDLDKMLAGYNWGQGNVDKAIKYANEHGVDWHTQLPSETKKYIAKISKKLHGAVAIGAASAGDYAGAANYARSMGTTAGLNYATRNEQKLNKPPRNPDDPIDEEDSKDQNNFISDMMKENPVLGLFLMIFGMMTGLISPADGNKLLGDFDNLPDSDPRKQKAIESLSPEDRKNYDSIRHLRDVSKDLHASTAAERTKELAERFVGQKEEPNNHGAIVRLSGIKEGDPWCGGYAHYIFGVTMPGVYDQKNYAAAISYKEEGEKYNAFHQKGGNAKPEVGDAVVFTREGGNHVGIVVAVDGDKITYNSGNHGDKVGDDTFSLKNDNAFMGFTSSRELAAAKHIDLDRQASVQTSQNKTIPPHVQALANQVPKVNIADNHHATKNTPVNLASTGVIHSTDTSTSAYIPPFLQNKNVGKS